MMTGLLSTLLLVSDVLLLAPAPKPKRAEPLTQTFTHASLQSVLNTLADQAGVRILYDSSFRDKNVDWSVEKETFDAALQKIFLVHDLAGREIQPGVVVVYPIQPQLRRRYESWTPSAALASVRNREPVRLSFKDASLQAVLEALGKHAGVKVIVDDSFRDRNVTVRFDGEAFEETLDQLTLPINLFHQPLDASTVVVAPDRPQLRRKYGQLETASFGPPSTPGCGEAAAFPFGNPLGSRVRLDDGVDVELLPGFTAGSSALQPTTGVYKHTETVTLPDGRRAVDRIVGDPLAFQATGGRRFVGYRLELQKSRDARSFRVEIKPLPAASWKRLCASCAAESQLKIERYPAPFDLGSGGSFAIDLMTNATNDQKLVDQVKITQPAPDRAKDARPRRYKVEWSMSRELDHVVAGVCVRDLDSGEALGGIPRFSVFPWSDSLVFSHDGRTKDGKPMNVVARMELGDDRRTAIYAVEIWLGGERTYVEETRLPLVLF